MPKEITFDLLPPEVEAEFLPQSPSPTPTLTPATAAAVAQASASLGPLGPQLSPAGLDQGMRPGVPFDPNSGLLGDAPYSNFDTALLTRNPILPPAKGEVSALDYVLAELGSQTPKAKAKYMSELTGQKIEVAPNGDLVARNVMDKKTGQVKDVLVNSRGLGLEDFLAIGAEIPSSAAEGLMALWTRGALRNLGPLKNRLGNIAATAIAGVTAPAVRETAGGVKDALFNLYDLQDPETQEITGRRMRNLQWSIGLNLGGSLLGAASRGLSPFGGGPKAAVTEQAEKALKEAQFGADVILDDGTIIKTKPTNVKITQTPAELTASGVLTRMERIAAGMPGAGPLAEFTANRPQQFLDIQKAYTGLDVLAPEAMGQKLKEATKPVLDNANVVVEKAKQGLVAAAEADVKTVGGIMNVPRIPPEYVGKSVRDVVRGKYDIGRKAFNDRYDDFLSKPEIKADVDVTGIVKPKIEAILADLPTFKQEVVEAATGKAGKLADSLGEDILTTKVVDKLFDRFIPQKFISKLEQLAQAEKMSVKSLKELRTSVEDDIAEGIAIPGTSVKRLGDLKKAINESIETVLAPNPGLLTEWKNLSKDYSKFKEPFSGQYIQKIMVPEGEPGGFGNTAIVYNLIGKGGAAVDAFRNLETFFGKGSKEMQGVMQAVKEKLIDDATTPGRGITVSSIYNILDSLDGPITKEIFKPGQIEDIRNAAKGLELQTQLDSDEVRALMRQGTFTGKALKDLAKAEEARNLVARNKIFDGSLADKNAVELSRAFLTPKTEPSEMAALMRQLRHDNPEVHDEFRAFATEDFIQKLSDFTGTTKHLQPTELVKFFKDPANKNLMEVYRTAMGDETFYSLKRLSEGLEPSVDALIRVGEAGGMARSSESMKSVHEPASFLTRAASRFILTMLYTSPGVRKLVTNKLMTPERVNAVVDGVLMSEPALEYLVNRYGEHARDIAAEAGFIANSRDRRLDMSKRYDLLPPEVEAQFFGPQNVSTNVQPNPLQQVVAP